MQIVAAMLEVGAAAMAAFADMPLLLSLLWTLLLTSVSSSLPVSPSLWAVALFAPLALLAAWTPAPGAGPAMRAAVLVLEAALYAVHGNPYLLVPFIFAVVRSYRDSPGLSRCHLLHNALCYPPVLPTVCLASIIFY